MILFLRLKVEMMQQRCVEDKDTLEVQGNLYEVYNNNMENFWLC